MIHRILSGWTFVRVVYVILGSMVIIQSALSKEWAGVIVGGYFASMGLFAFGCAAGNCFGGSCAAEPKQVSEDKPVQTD